jgi:hypothetical protein
VTDIYDGMDAFNSAQEEWLLVGVECRKDTQYALWRWSSAPTLGKLSTNGADWFTGDFDQAHRLWLAATGQG